MNEDLTELLRRGGPIATIAVDVSTSAMQPPAQAEGRRRDTTEGLTAAGADEDVIAALLGAIVQVPGAADPIGVAAAAAGDLLVQQSTPGEAPTQPVVEVSAVPDLSALLRGRERAIPVLVIESRAAGGTIHVYPSAGLAETSHEDVTGEDVLVQQAHAGGISQSAHAGSAEDALAQNAQKLADRAAVLVRQHGVGLVLITGDPRTAELTAQSLPDLDQVSVSALGKDTDAAGADPHDLAGAISAVVASTVAAAQALEVDRLSEGSYRLGSVGVDEVVEALQGAAVDVLLIGPDGVEGELLALDDAPWVARSEDESLGAGVIGTAAAGPVLVRAALLTGADVRFPGPGVLPDGAPVAAHRRRPKDD